MFMKFIKSQPKSQNTINSSINRRKKRLFRLVLKGTGFLIGGLIVFNTIFLGNAEAIGLIPLVQVFFQASEITKVNSSTDDHSDNDPRGN